MNDQSTMTAVTSRDRSAAQADAAGPRSGTLSRLRDALRDDTGAQTAEYGILTLAAVGFAGLLAVVLTSGDVQGLLTSLVTEALNRE